MVVVLVMRLIRVQTVQAQFLPIAAKGTPKLDTVRPGAVTAGSVAEMDFAERRTYDLAQVTIPRRSGKLGIRLIAKDGSRKGSPHF